MDYSIKKIGVEEQELIETTRFLKSVFPKSKAFSLDFIRWQYTQNPLGIMQGFNAWSDGKIVSHFAALPINMSLFGKEKRGLLCLNVSTTESFRGQMLFTELGQKTAERATEDGYDFMIAVPNGNSSHAFLKYFDFYLISPLTVKIGMGKNIYPAQQANCYKSWSNEQWTWRLSSPMNTYYADPQGTISTPLAPLLKTISQGQLSRESLAAIASIEQVSSPFHLYIGLGADTSKGLYFNMPSFIKRSPFNLVFKDLKNELPTIKKEDVFLQLIDLDTI